MNSFVRFVFILLLVSAAGSIVSCGKKKSSPPISSDEGDKKKKEEPTTPTPPSPTPLAPGPIVEQPIQNPSITENIVTRLITEIQNKYFLKASDTADDEELQAIATQKTNNLILAKTLKQVDLSFDSKGNPELAIETQEGSFDLELQPQQVQNKYILETEQGFFSRMFSSSEIKYKASIEVRGRYNSISIIELTRSTSDYESTVYILHLKRSGRLEIGQYSKEELLRDSNRLLEDLSTIQTVEAHFYHVMTEELDHTNRSEATRFALIFDIYFSLHSQNEVNGRIPLKKDTIFYGTQNSSNRSFWSGVGDFFHNSNAHRQGHIYTINSASYKPSVKVSPAEEDPLTLDISMKNKSGGSRKEQNLRFYIHFK